MTYKPPKRSMKEAYEAFSKKRKRIAFNKTVSCIHAKEAAAGGWINFLFDHYRYEDVYPAEDKVVWMKEQFKLQQDARKIPAAAEFKRMFQKSDELRKKLTDKVTNS